MIRLRPPASEDADRLFPLVYHTEVTKTIQWDGPASLEEYRQGMAERALRAQRGESHSFVIEELDEIAPQEPGIPVGMVDIRPYKELFRADIGLFVGLPYQGKGYGTTAVRCLVEYGFARLELEKIEAFVFVGNLASRRIFEKNGFLLEGAIRSATYKRGQYLDEWLLGITRHDYEFSAGWIVHLCSLQSWLEAKSQGVYIAPSLVEEGFIHASRPAQMEAVANAFYRGQPDLVLLWIDPARLQAEIRWEAGVPPETGGGAIPPLSGRDAVPPKTVNSPEAPVDGQVFPHIFAPINLDAVLTVTGFRPGEDGFFRERPLPIDR